MLEYSKALLWSGLNDLIRKDAVRRNNGPLIIMYWKYNMVNFKLHHHPKYFEAGHRLLACKNILYHTEDTILRRTQRE